MELIILNLESILTFIYIMIIMKFKVCPQCGSDNIEWIIPQNWSQWSCNDCSYTGLVIEVDKDTQKKIQKEWKETGRIISSKDDEEEETD